MSRLSKPELGDEWDDYGVTVWINAIVESVAIDVIELKRSSINDEELIAGTKAIVSGDWQTKDAQHALLLRNYFPFKDELTEMDEYVIQDNRVVIPVAPL